MDFDVPPASMAMFDTISIIVLIPIYDGILTPIFKRLGCELSMLQRTGWGFLVAAAAMLVCPHPHRILFVVLFLSARCSCGVLATLARLFPFPWFLHQFLEVLTKLFASLCLVW
jgi:dipeptide/tripeptide permease